MAADPPGSPGWWRDRYRPARGRRPRPDGLSLDRILTAALTVVDADGLEALTMRRLAAELSTTHTSLYRHVASRDELIVLLVDHVLGDIRMPVSRGRRRADISAWAREFRRVLLEHPALVPAVVSGQLLGPNSMGARETALRALLDAGAEPVVAVHAYLLVAHYVIGTALLDTGGAARTAPVRAAMAELFASLPADRYPTVLGLAGPLNRPDRDAEFEFGLDTLLDGLEPRLLGSGLHAAG